jgi:hypothetical protein
VPVAVPAKPVEKKPAEKKPAARKPQPAPRGAQDADEDLLFDDDSDHPRRKARRLVRDPKTGELVAEKRRKHSRRNWRDEVDPWTGEDDFDFDDDLMDFTEEDFLSGGDDDEDE